MADANAYKPLIVIMPEDHMEDLAEMIGRLEVASNGVPNNYKEQSYKQKCRETKVHLADEAERLLGYQCSVMGSPLIDTLYLETFDNENTRALYGKCLDNKKVVWLRERDAQEDAMRKRAELGFTDPQYKIRQAEWDDSLVGKITDNLPSQGKAGLLKIGKSHAERAQEGLIAAGYATKMLGYQGYSNLAENLLKKSSIDSNYVRTSAEIRANFG